MHINLFCPRTKNSNQKNSSEKQHQIINEYFGLVGGKRYPASSGYRPLVWTNYYLLLSKLLIAEISERN